MPIHDSRDAIELLGPTRAIIKKFSDAQRSLQKLNATIRVKQGCSASNPLRGQGRVLTLLSDGEVRRQRDIADALRIRPQSLGEMLVKLEDGGFIERQTGQGSSHAHSVKITEKGLDCIRRAPKLDSFESFSDEDVVQFMDYLDRFIGELDRQTELLHASSENDGAR